MIEVGPMSRTGFDRLSLSWSWSFGQEKHPLVLSLSKDPR